MRSKVAHEEGVQELQEFRRMKQRKNADIT
jgi:hypothetical protein